MRLALVPNVHYLGGLLCMLSVTSLVNSEHLLAIAFFALATALSLLSFEYFFLTLFGVYISVNLPTKRHNLTTYK